MRVVFVGASSLAVVTAKLMRERGDEVVIIEHDKDHIDALPEELDCGFLHGDGSEPAILREADPNGTDVLFALTDNDQANILASLVGARSASNGWSPRSRTPNSSTSARSWGSRTSSYPRARWALFRERSGPRENESGRHGRGNWHGAESACQWSCL